MTQDNHGAVCDCQGKEDMTMEDCRELKARHFKKCLLRKELTPCFYIKCALGPVLVFEMDNPKRGQIMAMENFNRNCATEENGDHLAMNILLNLPDYLTWKRNRMLKRKECIQ